MAISAGLVLPIILFFLTVTAYLSDLFQWKKDQRWAIEPPYILKYGESPIVPFDQFKEDVIEGKTPVSPELLSAFFSSSKEFNGILELAAISELSMGGVDCIFECLFDVNFAYPQLKMINRSNRVIVFLMVILPKHERETLSAPRGTHLSIDWFSCFLINLDNA